MVLEFKMPCSSIDVFNVETILCSIYVMLEKKRHLHKEMTNNTYV